MRSVPRLPALLLLGALTLGQERPFEDDPPLRLDEPIRITLREQDPLATDKGRGRWFRLDVGEEGPITLDVSSYDLDVFLMVFDDRETRIALAHGTAPDWNEHWVLKAEAGCRYRIGALAGSMGTGEVLLTARRGEVPLPTGDAALAARVAFNQEVARRAAARGDGFQQRTSLMNVGSLGWELGELDAAQLALEELLPLATEAGDDVQRWAAEAFLGAIEWKRRRPHRAIERLQPAREAARALRDRRPVIERFALDHLANALLDVNRVADAAAAWEQLLDLAQASGDARTEAIALGQAGRVRARLGESAQARALLERSVDTARIAGDAAVLCDSLVRLGEDHLRLGDTDGARRCFEQARDTAPDEMRAMQALGNLGTLQTQAGRYAEARDCFERVAAWAERAGAPEMRSSALQNLGLVSFYLGAPRQALEELDAAMTASDGLDAERRMDLHFHRSVVWASLGERGRQAAELEASLAVARAAGLLAREALLLAQLGACALLADDEDTAQRRLEEAAASLRTSGDSAARGAVLTNVADMALRRGDLPTARRTAREAADALLAWGLPQQALDPLRTLGQAALRAGDADAVAQILAEAEPILSRSLTADLSADERAGVRTLNADWAELETDLVALRAARAPDAEARARVVAEGFGRAGRWKGRALLEGLAPESASAAGLPEAAAVLRERTMALTDGWALAGRSLRERAGDGGEGERDAAAAALAAQARERVETLTARLARLSPRDALLVAPPECDPETVRAQVLGPGRVLVDYAQGGISMYAYVLTEDRLDLLDLGPRASIEEAARRHLGAMSDPHDLGEVEDVLASGRELYERLLAPVLALGAGPVTGLLVVPTGELSRLPFESLVVAGDGATRFADVTFVLDRWPVSYGPSTPVLVALAETGPRAMPGRVAVLGDPLYPLERPSLARSDIRGLPRAEDLARLPATRDEALAVAQVVMSSVGDADATERLAALRDARSGSLRTDAVEVYLGEDASPERLAGDLTGWSVLHCASHGYADPEDPRRSGLVLSFGDERPGYVPLASLLEMRLDADLTVLSACETAGGRLLRGEGVQSVARAFLHAGSRSVVASLWQVSDAETALTMEDFYRAWRGEGRPLPEALREAKLSVRRGTPVSSAAVRGGLLRAPPARADGRLAGHPYSWAPFVHIGRP